MEPFPLQLEEPCAHLSYASPPQWTKPSKHQAPTNPASPSSSSVVPCWVFGFRNEKTNGHASQLNTLRHQSEMLRVSWFIKQTSEGHVRARSPMPPPSLCPSHPHCGECQVAVKFCPCKVDGKCLPQPFPHTHITTNCSFSPQLTPQLPRLGTGYPREGVVSSGSP